MGELTNPLAGYAGIAALNYGVLVNPYAYMAAYKGGVLAAGYQATNYQQTIGTSEEAGSGTLYGGYTWRDMPKSRVYLTPPEAIHASFILGSSENPDNSDLYTTVVEASNGHQYWLNQTLTVKIYYNYGWHDVSHTFTEADWATTPIYDPSTGIGYEANPYGPSKFHNRYPNKIAFSVTYFSPYESITTGDPQSPFQPPGG
jgi:hypothetical protein